MKRACLTLIASLVFSSGVFANEIEAEISEFLGLGSEDLYIETTVPQIFSQSEVQLSIDTADQKLEWDLMGRIHYSEDGRKIVLLYSQIERDLARGEWSALKLVGAVEVANDNLNGLGTYGRSSIFLLAETSSEFAEGSLSVGPAMTLSFVDGNLRKALGVQSSLKLMGESRFFYGGFMVDFYIYPEGHSAIEQQIMTYQASGAMITMTTGVNIPKLNARIGGEWQIGRAGDAYCSYIGIRITKKF